MRSDNDRRGMSESAQGSLPAVFMTDFVSAGLLIVQSTSSLTSHVTGKLRTWWQRARERAELARMSEAELHDIGASSTDRWSEIHKPFWRK